MHSKIHAIHKVKVCARTHLPTSAAGSALHPPPTRRVRWVRWRGSGAITAPAQRRLLLLESRRPRALRPAEAAHPPASRLPPCASIPSLRGGLLNACARLCRHACRRPRAFSSPGGTGEPAVARGVARAWRLCSRRAGSRSRALKPVRRSTSWIVPAAASAPAYTL